MRHLAVVGGGVVGLLCAFAALRHGQRVTLIDPQDSANISWTGSRIVRDEPDGQKASNTRAWRALLRMVDCDDAIAGPLNHITGDTATVEHDAFVVDTSTVRGKLLRSLEQSERFTRLVTSPVVRVSDCGHRLYGADGSNIQADHVIVAAGKGSRTLLPQAASRVKLCFQVFAQFAAQGTSGIVHPFIQHDGDRGLWGMPQIGDQPAKISASDLCFSTGEAAINMMSSRVARAAFLDRARILFPGMDLQSATFESQSYAASDTRQPHRRGAAIFHLACNGSDFKRAPLVATGLLRHIRPLVRTL